MPDIIQWEKEYQEQMKGYSEFKEFLHRHTRFLDEATRDLTEHPPQKGRMLAQQKKDAELSPFEKGTKRKSNRAPRLLKKLQEQVEQIRGDIEAATQRLPRLPR
jgi:hypothetical protein